MSVWTIWYLTVSLLPAELTGVSRLCVSGLPVTGSAEACAAVSARSDPSRLVFTSQRRLTRQLVLWSARGGAEPCPPADDQHAAGSPPATQKALLSIVWTRALRSSVLERWGCSGSSSGSGSGCSARWLTELTLQLKPCDLVLTPAVLLPLSRLLEPLLVPLLARPAPPPLPTPAPRGLATNSGSLPLVYARCDALRLLLPAAGGGVCLLRMGALRLEPAAEFPLQRPVLRPDLLQEAQAAGTLSTPGADVEDRHYQAELTGLTIATGAHWALGTHWRAGVGSSPSWLAVEEFCGWHLFPNSESS